MFSLSTFGEIPEDNNFLQSLEARATFAGVIRVLSTLLDSEAVANIYTSAGGVELLRRLPANSDGEPFEATVERLSRDTNFNFNL